MPKQPWRPDSRPRTTVKVTGTATKVRADLNFDACLSLAYAQAWLSQHGRLKVPSSGVLRRALAVYMRHLGQETTDPAAEVRAAHQACRAFLVSEDDQQAAWARLQAIDKGNPLPAFSAIATDRDAQAWLAALDDRVDAITTGAIHQC